MFVILSINTFHVPITCMWIPFTITIHSFKCLPPTNHQTSSPNRKLNVNIHINTNLLRNIYIYCFRHEFWPSSGSYTPVWLTQCTPHFIMCKWHTTYISIITGVIGLLRCCVLAQLIYFFFAIFWGHVAISKTMWPSHEWEREREREIQRERDGDTSGGHRSRRPLFSFKIISLNLHTFILTVRRRSSRSWLVGSIGGGNRAVRQRRVKQRGGEVWECVWCSSGKSKKWIKVKGSKIQIVKLHQAPPIYYIAVNCYSEVTGSITNK